MVIQDWLSLIVQWCFGVKLNPRYGKRDLSAPPVIRKVCVVLWSGSTVRYRQEGILRLILKDFSGLCPNNGSRVVYVAIE